MKISYVTTYDARDIHNWSGLGYMIAKSLSDQGAEMDYIGDLKSSPSVDLRVMRIYYRLLGKNFDLFREPQIAQQHARQISQLIKSDSDIIFSPSSLPIALLESKKPKVFYTDATFAGMLGFYKSLSNLPKSTIKHGNFLEKQALDSSRLAIYSSDWAAESAISLYNINPDKVKVVPFGANLEIDRTLEDIKVLISQKSQKVCHLLFMAVDWERKGGDLAVQIAQDLIQSGLEVRLHIVGIPKLPLKSVPDFIVNYGFVSKSTAAGRNQIDKLLAESHFLLLPTRADCTPVVFSEANSYGLPCITTDVGGVKTVVRDDVNGRAFSLDGDSTHYSGYIEAIFRDKKRYEDLCLSSFNEYKTRLNWEVAGKKILGFMKDL